MRCSMNLTLDGRTLVYVWPKDGEKAIQPEDELAIAFVRMMGEPQAWVFGESGGLVMLFPHQDMPDNVKDIAERMTTQHLIKHLESGACTGAA